MSFVIFEYIFYFHNPANQNWKFENPFYLVFIV